MCIRDSVVIGDPMVLHQLRQLRAADRDGLGALGPEVLNPCLLYTSDAADERSSVDLGGRRIIKKQKCDDGDVGGGPTDSTCA